MRSHLLDANLLIALVWPTHEFHIRAQGWFAENSRYGWATCPFTQAAFIRILSNPAFSQDAVSPQEASSLLRANVGHPHHMFWSDDISPIAAIDKFSNQITGHRQITDAYLLALAIRHQGRLATMDKALELFASAASENDLIAVV